MTIVISKHHHQSFFSLSSLLPLCYLSPFLLFSISPSKVHTIESRLHNQSNLKCDILLDHLRGTRGCPNSVSLFTNILQSSQQLRLYLYHTPLLKGVVKRLLPERFNEVFGLQHTKILLVDNNVLLTG